MTKILIVDDNSQNLYLLETIFKGSGFEVIVSKNGKEALESARETPPDIILTDILMPVMDGFELCRRWKADDLLSQIPFVFYTATYTGAQDERFALSLGAERFLIKPQRTEALLQVVNDVLEQRRQMKYPPVEPKSRNETETIRQYNEVLFSKLENKVKQLEQEIENRKKVELEVQTKNQELLKSLTEKEILLQELFHRTKNTLQIICALLDLQAKEFSGNHELNQFVEIIQKRIQAISLVHRMLYKAQDLSHISIKDYIYDLTHLIIKGFDTVKERIKLELEVDKLYFVLDTAIPFGLILNELMTNSLKYAFPGERAGDITISLTRIETSRLKFQYSDNGVGVPPDFDFSSQTTLGLRLIRTLAENQMQGRVSIDCSHGISFIMEFPIALYEARV